MKITNKTKTMNKIETIYKTTKAYTVTLPLLDKLSGVVDLPDRNYANMICANIIEAFEESSKDVIQKKPSKGYTLACLIPYPDKDGVFSEKPNCLFFEMKVPKLEKAQARFDFNPVHMSAVAWDWLDNIFENVPVGMTFRQFVAHARYTRVDVQRQILECDPSDFLFHGKWKKQSRSYTSDKNGLETLYLGSSQSNQIAIYNKKVEQDSEFQGLGECRIECRQKINLTLAQLKQMKDPFLLVNITSLECANPPLGIDHWRAFQDSCKLRGTKGAVDHQRYKVRASLRKALASNKVTWWQMSQKEWDISWGLAIKQAGLDALPQDLVPLTMAYHSGSK